MEKSTYCVFQNKGGSSPLFYLSTLDSTVYFYSTAEQRDLFFYLTQKACMQCFLDLTKIQHTAEFNVTVQPVRCTLLVIKCFKSGGDADVWVKSQNKPSSTASAFSCLSPTKVWYNARSVQSSLNLADCHQSVI